MTETLKAGAFALALMISEFATALFISSFGIENQLIEVCISYGLGFGLPALIYLKMTKANIKSTLFLNEMNIYNFILVILISFAIIPAVYFLSGISVLVFPNVISANITPLADKSLPELIICLALFPAVFEEICYRGVIFSGYGNVSLKKAAIVCGLLFAMAHLSAQQFLYSFAVGVLFCFMTYYTKSIYATTITHFILNAVQVVSLKASVGVEAAPITLSSVATLGVFAVSSLPILALLFFAFIKINSVHLRILFVSNENILQHNPDKRYEEKAVTWPVIVIAVIYILMAAF